MGSSVLDESATTPGKATMLHGQLEANAATATNRKSVTDRSTQPGGDSAQQLHELLQQLGAPADTAATRCFQHVHGATTRAVANIADWMTYLPEDCVRAMVKDGWHWST